MPPPPTHAFLTLLPTPSTPYKNTELEVSVQFVHSRQNRVVVCSEQTIIYTRDGATSGPIFGAEKKKTFHKKSARRKRRAIPPWHHTVPVVSALTCSVIVPDTAGRRASSYNKSMRSFHFPVRTALLAPGEMRDAGGSSRTVLGKKIDNISVCSRSYMLCFCPGTAGFFIPTANILMHARRRADYFVLSH